MNFLTICNAVLFSPHEFQFEKEVSLSVFISCFSIIVSCFSISISCFSISGDGGFGLLRNVAKKSSVVG
jgi:hypothetical protein